MSGLILPPHLRPVVLNHDVHHLHALSKLDMLAGFVHTVRHMPEEQFDNPTLQPVVTMPFALAIELAGVLSSVMTVCNAEAAQMMQENPGTFMLQNSVAQALPMLVWISTGMFRAAEKLIAQTPEGMVAVPLSQHRHAVHMVCDAIDLMSQDVRKKYAGAANPGTATDSRIIT